MIDENLLKQEEKAIYSLRSLYRKYGYLPFKMSKFEEYELYIRNKDFLVSDRVITFNDTNGKLMALKPDVTLSIIKNGEDIPGVKQKVYYNENVYRVSESTHQYKEIMQAGLECIGDIDLYDISEVISLAAESLAMISESFILEVSHLGVLSAMLEMVCPDKSFEQKATRFISKKNAHDLRRLCEEYGADEKAVDRLEAFVSTYGRRDEVIARLKEICPEEVTRELEELSAMLDNSPYSHRIHFDFSVVNDMNYYNHFAFRGFLDGVCDSVLSGGQYDKLMQKMGRSSGAIGFALYLDLLEQLPKTGTGYDVDVLLCYDDGISSTKVAAKVRELIGQGFVVSAQKGIPEKLRYKLLMDMTKEGEGC